MALVVTRAFNVRYQPNFTVDVTDRPVAQIDNAVNRAAQLQHSDFYLVNNNREE